MNFKRFNETDAEYGKAAELAAYEMMKTRGFNVVELPHGVYGKDLKCTSKHEEFYVECERRSPKTWGANCDYFPYPTYNFPKRRLKDGSQDRILIVFRCDLEKCLIVFYQDVEKASARLVSNRCVKDETVFDIPINRCLLLNTSQSSQETFAEMNSKRVERLFPLLGHQERKRFLEIGKPYGVSDFEYRNMLARYAEPTWPSLQCRKSPYTQPTLF
ncbi:MAG: hypothetical protein EB060_10415 [Proteobacteria bacterium]|nr:hypothetical protein [Pseudomonadota bacterium]